MYPDIAIKRTLELPPSPAEITTWRTRAGAALLVLGAFGVVLAWVPSRLFDLERYLVPKAFALHVVALGLVVLGLVPLRREAWDRTGLLLVAFVGWSGLSALLAANRWLAWSAWGISFSSAVVYLAARGLPVGLRWRVFAGVLGAVVVGAALGLAQAYGFESSWLSDSRPPGGTFGNRNFLGHVAAIAAPALLMFTVCARRRSSAVLGLVAVGVLTAAIVLTRSRAAWLGAIAGVATASIALWWVARSSTSGIRVGRLGVAGVVAVAAIALAVLAPNELDWRADSPYASTLTRLADYQQGSGRGRLVQYRNSLDLVVRNPIFGSGPGNWFVDYPLVTSRGDPAYADDIIPTNPWPSSDWVALLAERGAVGTILLLLAGGAALVGVMGAMRTVGESGERIPAIGERNEPAAAGAVAGVLSAALVCGMFDAVLLLAAPAYLTWAIVGLMLPREEPDWREIHEPVAAPSHAPRAAVAAVALLLVLYTGAHATAISLTAKGTGTQALARAALFAPGEHRIQIALAQRGRCSNARRAAGLMPHHTRVTRLAARCR